MTTPLVGQPSEDILQALGYDAQTIATLRDAQVI
jgi:hypothetical protein